MRDLISRQAAIDALKGLEFHQYMEFGEYIGEDTREVRLIRAEKAQDALQNLPPAQPEQTDCIYCHEDSDGYVTPLEKNCHAFIRFGMTGWELSLKANGWHGSAKIRYCPMCGRRLEHG